ncbi:MAG: hypothetical protein ACO3JL_01575 [Myxococcota bacterium]
MRLTAMKGSGQLGDLVPALVELLLDLTKTSAGASKISVEFIPMRFGLVEPRLQLGLPLSRGFVVLLGVGTSLAELLLEL